MIKMISVKRSCKTMEYHRAESSGTLQKWKNRGNCETGDAVGRFQQMRLNQQIKRIRSGSYRKNQRSSSLPLPIGVSDFRLAQAEYYYVDKTMLIKDFIDERPMVTLLHDHADLEKR